jgi:hypothetical protein
LLGSCAEARQGPTNIGRGCTIEFANYIVNAYGVREVLEDIDRRRRYWKEGDTIICRTLNWVAEEGFKDFFGSHGGEYSSAEEYRQRFLINAIIALAKRR